MRKHSIENVVVMGVHTNMCVLGRPFSIRRHVTQGQNVVLVRDLTDSMHDSLSPPPGLDHFRATDLVVEHIEKYWCPTITSRDLLGGVAFSFKEDRRPHVVFVIGEDEYDTAATLPIFAERDLATRGLRTTMIHASPRDKNDFPGLQALASADLMLVSVRRRTLPTEQLDLIRRFAASGKPIVGIRTASHAFAAFDGQSPQAGHATWPEFDAEILGGHYTGHHGSGDDGKPHTFVWAWSSERQHTILTDFPDGELPVRSWLYKTRPLAETATTLLLGRVEGPDPAEPVAWTNQTEQGSRVFYTSLGHPADFDLPAFRELLMRGIFSALDRPVPDEPPPSDATRNAKNARRD